MNIFSCITSIDFTILDFIQNTIRCEFLDYVMAFFSYLGEAGGIWIITAIIMLCFRKTRATGVMIICAVAIGLLIGEIGMKNIIGRLRPFVQNPAIEPNISPPSGYSFPSGHSCSSFAAATVIFMQYKKIGILSLVVATLIAFSRLYNYVHFPTDVIAGILLGILCAVAVVCFFRKTGLDKKCEISSLRYKKDAP